MGKRRLASVLVELYRQKGTAKGIQTAIRFLLGIDISAISPFNADTLHLDKSEAEDPVDAQLGETTDLH